MDERLGWTEHITTLCKKLTKAIYAIRTIKNVSTHQAAKYTYYSHFHSVASYGVIVWGMSPAAERVQILQKKAIRTLCNLHYRDSCREVFKSEKILTITSVYILCCVKFVRANSSRFTKNEEVHNYNTRNKESFTIPHHRLTVAQQGVDYWGAKLYNHLPTEVKNMSNKKFGKAVKELLMKETFYEVSDFLNSSF